MSEIEKMMQNANVGDTIIANPIQDCYDTYILVKKALEENS